MYLNGIDFSRACAIRVMEVLPKTIELSSEEYRGVEDSIAEVLQECFEEEILEEEAYLEKDADATDFHFESRSHGDAMLDAVMDATQGLYIGSAVIDDNTICQPTKEIFIKDSKRIKLAPKSDWDATQDMYTEPQDEYELLEGQHMVAQLASKLVSLYTEESEFISFSNKLATCTDPLIRSWWDNVSDTERKYDYREIMKLVKSKVLNEPPRARVIKTSDECLRSGFGEEITELFNQCVEESLHEDPMLHEDPRDYD